jgi:hypothetical protein
MVEKLKLFLFVVRLIHIKFSLIKGLMSLIFDRFLFIVRLVCIKSSLVERELSLIFN